MRTLIACSSLLLAACATSHMDPATPVQLSPAEVKAVQEGLRKDLKDPDSARVGPMIAGRNAKVEIKVCGWINAKTALVVTPAISHTSAD